MSFILHCLCFFLSNRNFCKCIILHFFRFRINPLPLAFPKFFCHCILPSFQYVAYSRFLTVAVKSVSTQRVNAARGTARCRGVQPKRSAADRRELEANYYAACALAGKGREAISRLKPPDDPEQHHELAYNRGCCEAQCGATEAPKTLEKALSGAERAVEEDGASLQEKTDETAQYAAQLAYALERSGDSGQAVERAKTLLKAKPSDSAVRFAATCTLVAARRDETDLFDSHKRLKPYAASNFSDLNDKHAALGRLLWARTLFAMGKHQDALSSLEKPFTTAEDQCDAELLIAVHSQPEKQKKKVRRRRVPSLRLIRRRRAPLTAIFQRRARPRATTTPLPKRSRRNASPTPRRSSRPSSRPWSR